MKRKVLVGSVIKATRIGFLIHQTSEGIMMLEPLDLEAVGWDALSSCTFKELVASTPAGVAVFDADGTLWDGDVGEALFVELIRRGLIEQPGRETELIQQYKDLCEKDVTHGYGWIVQQMAGLSESEVETIASELMEEHVRDCAFPPMVGLARWLESKGWQSWIVSASAEVVVCAGARHMGLREDRVLGVQLGIHEERYLPHIVQLPNLQGKVDAIQAAGIHPHLAAGNSVNDIPMLAMSTGLQLCVNPCDDLYNRALEGEWNCVAMGEPQHRS